MTTTTITALVNEQLDMAFDAAMKNVIAQIETMTLNATSRLQKILSQLDERAQQLEDGDSNFTEDDAVLAQAMEETNNTLITTQTLLDPTMVQLEQDATKIAVVAVTAKVFLNLANAAILRGIDPSDPASLSFFRSRTPTAWELIDSVSAADFITSSPEWIARMNGWGTGYADIIRTSILDGIAAGNGPYAIAEKMRQLATALPKYAAENIARTLQINAYRDRSIAMEEANGQFIEYKIRIATLDNRTCLSCIALHGTRLEKGQKVDDHYRGRCSEFYVVPGGPRLPSIMQADSTPGNRRFVPFQSGMDWFNSLPENRQRLQASFLGSPGKFNAFKYGAVSLADFVGHRVDSVFGEQAIERSLKAILGEEAASQYYVRNYGS